MRSFVSSFSSALKPPQYILASLEVRSYCWSVNPLDIAWKNFHRKSQQPLSVELLDFPHVVMSSTIGYIHYVLLVCGSYYYARPRTHRYIYAHRFSYLILISSLYGDTLKWIHFVSKSSHRWSLYLLMNKFRTLWAHSSAVRQLDKDDSNEVIWVILPSFIRRTHVWPPAISMTPQLVSLANSWTDYENHLKLFQAGHKARPYKCFRCNQNCRWSNFSTISWNFIRILFLFI